MSEIHYGIWHPEKGWYWASHSKLFVTTVKYLAEAQLDIYRRACARFKHVSGEDYIVREIEEWSQSIDNPCWLQDAIPTED